MTGDATYGPSQLRSQLATARASAKATQRILLTPEPSGRCANLQPVTSIGQPQAPQLRGRNAELACEERYLKRFASRCLVVRDQCRFLLFLMRGRRIGAGTFRRTTHAIFNAGQAGIVPGAIEGCSMTQYQSAVLPSVDALKSCMTLHVVGEQAGIGAAIMLATIIVGLAGGYIEPSWAFVFHGNCRAWASVVCRLLGSPTTTSSKRDRRRNQKQRAHSITPLFVGLRCRDNTAPPTSVPRIVADEQLARSAMAQLVCFCVQLGGVRAEAGDRAAHLAGQQLVIDGQDLD
jgi:hypothetical protein